MRTHAVPSDVFDLLASGGGDMQGVLRDGQRSKRLLLIHEVIRAARREAPSLAAEADTDRASALLADAQRRAPGPVDALLLHPQVGAWASHCLAGLVAGRGIAPEDLGHLGAVAAAAALRAGMGFRVRAHLRDGGVMLPTNGLARPGLGGWDGWCEMRSRSEAGGVEVATPDAATAVSFAPGPTWQPLRRLSSSANGLDVELDLDDLDPYRSGGMLAIRSRLTDSEAVEWQASLDEAWATLVDDHPASAEAIRTGVASVVPLRSTEDDAQLSATVHHAVGAVAMTAPEQPLNMTLALVHEFQHTKLSALLDLVPLVERGTTDRYYSPWRRDPRPLSGLLQGTYAFLALTRFWNVHRQRAHRPDEPDPRLAHFEFALGRGQVRQAATSLLAADELRPWGVRFVEGIRRRLSTMADAEVPALAGWFADLARRDHQLSWRLRNLRPDPGLIADLMDAWLAGHPRPRWDRPPQPVVHDGGGPIPSDPRSDLIRRRLGFPASQWRDGADPAAVLLVDRQVPLATDAYRSRLGRDPTDLTAWSGWALTTGAIHPERVHSLHSAILTRTGAAPLPDVLAAWLR